MVYRGKPGLGCDLCRKRRLVCDRRRPSCSQCLRIHQECSGYRDPTTVRIFDQTDEVVQKAKARAHKSASTTPDRALTPTRISPPPISIDDHVMSHIFTYWVGTAENQGILWYLPDLLSKDPSPALQISVKALGLASMSGVQSKPELSRSAVEMYGTALVAVNDALRNPALATCDSTLATVTMLSTYELIMSTMGRHSMHGWMNHILGATRMLELRGEDQLNSDTGIYLFDTVTVLNAVSGLMFRYSKHHSQRIWELSEMVETKEGRYRENQNFYRLIVRVNDLAVKIDNAEKSIENLTYLLQQALHFDVELNSWAMSLGPTWQWIWIGESPSPPDTTTCHSGSQEKPEKHHMYPNAGAAGMWNFYRQVRIIVNQMIRSISSGLLRLQWTGECEHIMHQSVATIKQMVGDICASVAFYFMSGPPGVGAMLRLQIPLFIAGICTDPASERYAWIVGKLELLASLTGFEQTKSLARRLKEADNRGIVPHL